MVGAVVGSPPWRGSGYRPAVQMPTQNRIGSHWPSGGVLGQCCVDASAQPARSRNLIFFHPFVLMRDGAPLGARTPNLLILGPLFRLVADRCDDLRFRRSRSLDDCGHLVLSRRYLVSEKYPSDLEDVLSSCEGVRSWGRQRGWRPVIPCREGCAACRVYSGGE